MHIMDRGRAVERIATEDREWDVLVIGGGATGLGTAVDAASRGYRTLLVEQRDFASATSSRSTKLIHGGVRYLKQGNVSLVRGALRERERLCRNAPHLVRSLPFLIPAYRWWELPYYGAGLKAYDAFAGRTRFPRSGLVRKKRAIKELPTLETKGLLGGVLYSDGQFDDARLALTLAGSVFDHGGVALNYVRVTGLLKENARIRGAEVRDEETGQTHRIRAKMTINATGVFSDGIQKMDDPNARESILPSQGSHIVLPKKFQPGTTALMVPKTDDGRVLFAIPWQDRVVVGTTDTQVSRPESEPKPFSEEIEFLLSHAARYLSEKPAKEDVLSVFAGLRPLIRGESAKASASLSRDHVIFVSEGGLVSIAGGKWTTYRKMGEDALNRAEQVAGLPHRPCRTASLLLHGAGKGGDVDGATPEWNPYGSDTVHVKALGSDDLFLDRPLHANLPYHWRDIVWAIRAEMARTVEDVLSRRTRALILDARAAMEVAPEVAKLMARELDRDPAWEKETLANCLTLAKRYVLKE